MLKAIHAQENQGRPPRPKASAVVDELRRQRMGRAAELVDADAHETLTYYAFPDCHWIREIRTNNPARADHARDPATNARGRGVPRRSVLPEPRRGPAPATSPGDRAVQIDVFANELGGDLGPGAGWSPARPRVIDPAEPRFIGEHDPQATTAPGGSRLAFLTAFGKPFF